MSEECYTAVVDRFEETADDEEVAVVLLEEDDAVTEELVVPRERLPADGNHQDAVLMVQLDGSEPVGWSYDSEATAARREGAASRFDQLSERLSDADDTDDDEG